MFDGSVLFFLRIGGNGQVLFFIFENPTGEMQQQNADLGFSNKGLGQVQMGGSGGSVWCPLKPTNRGVASKKTPDIFTWM